MQGSVYHLSVFFSLCSDRARVRRIAGGGEFRTLEVQTVFEFGPDEPFASFPWTCLGVEFTPFDYPALGPAVALPRQAPGGVSGEVLKVPVEVVLAAAYDQLVNDLAEGKVELALCLSYMKTAEKWMI